jgi:hypothetical protein
MFGPATTMESLEPPSAGATVGSALQEPAPAASSPWKWSTKEAAKCSPFNKKRGITPIKGKVQGKTHLERFKRKARKNKDSKREKSMPKNKQRQKSPKKIRKIKKN